MSSHKANKKEASRIKEQQQPYETEPYERYEIINNVRFDLKPAPTVNHQHLVVNLAFFMKLSCRDHGIILVSPLDVYLDEANQFQPDLVFILHEHREIVKPARIEGAPDLVAEVLSPSTSKNDKISKKVQYERFGVQEYWLVDPVHWIVEQFILRQGKFDLYATYAAEGTLTSPLFSCIAIDLQKLFAPLQPHA